MTLKGAAQVMRRSSQDDLARQTQLLEHLQRIRAALVEVREELKTGSGEQLVDDTIEEISEPAVKEQPAKKVAKPLVEPVHTAEVDVVAEPAEQEAASQEEQPKRRAVRRKKKSDEESKELFPFYEQSLF